MNGRADGTDRAAPAGGAQPGAVGTFRFAGPHHDRSHEDTRGYTAMLEWRMLMRRVNAMLKQRIRRYGIAFVKISGGK